jgi:Ca2+-binding RTX toxin-like protein
MTSVKPITGSKGDDNIVGTRFEDTIYGRAGKDELNGGKGDDLIYGDGGDDTLIGGADDDILIGGAGRDIHVGSSGTDGASYAKSKIGLTINMANTSLSTGDAFQDQYRQIEFVIGSQFDDKLTGDTKSNILIGGGGNDRIDGGGGNDELLGEAGADTFVFSGPGSATDLRRMNDFDAEDHIELSRAGFGLHPQYQLTLGTTLIVADDSPVASTNSPTFLFEKSTDLLYFDADGNGSGASFLIASFTFNGQLSLDTSDFTIV